MREKEKRRLMDGEGRVNGRDKRGSRKGCGGGSI
jgi:hypothetical protein